jgi:hypothetical protein
MAVHMIRVYAAKGGYTLEEVQQAVSDWVQSHTEWTADIDDHQIELREANPDPGATEYFQGEFRFELDDAKDNLLQKAADKLKNKVPWFRLVYHQCDHDTEAGDGCSSEERWNWEGKDVTVPADVERKVPEAPTTVNA